MKYEKEILNNLLKELGIFQKINDRIKPNKHPYMKILEKSLKKHKLNYSYFVWTDSLAINQVYFGEHTSLSHTLMMPSIDGISVIMMMMNDKGKMKNIMQEMCNSLDYIIPDNIPYDIMGIA
tara:strand:+ start:2216 stop:2581 length:366 start_codon:yes stop_codon:yes gene_type:complete